MHTCNWKCLTIIISSLVEYLENQALVSIVAELIQAGDVFCILSRSPTQEPFSLDCSVHARSVKESSMWCVVVLHVACAIVDASIF